MVAFVPEWLFQVDSSTGEQEPLTYDTPVADLPIVDDARWSAALTDHSLGALVVWILLLLVLQAVAWPLVRRVFHRFPDRGWGFSRLVTLLLSGYAVWLLASLEVIAFRAIWCGLAVVGATFLARLVGVRERSWRDLLPPTRVAMIAEGVFWAFFALFIVFRLINPDSWHPVWGGEKPMEFAHLNAILRSPYFPPVDPWYAQGYINYYYYGSYLVAFLFKLTGIPSEIGFNLAQPTMIALFASGVFTVGAALASRVARTSIMTIIGGLLAVLLVNVSGNLVAVARIVERFRSDEPINEFVFWFWGPSRGIPDPNLQTGITEFPWFTATYADLHAHVVAFPMTVLIVGLAFVLIDSSRGLALATLRPGAHRPTTVTIVVTLGLLALTLGSLFPTNAWDVPTFGAVAAIGLLTATRSIRSLPTRLAITAGMGAIVGIVAYALVLPFYSSYVALFGEVERVRSQSPLLAVESHIGVFLLIVLFGLGAVLVGRVRRPAFVFDPAFVVAALGTVMLLRWFAAGRESWLIATADIALVIAVLGLLLSLAWASFDNEDDFGVPTTVLKVGAALVGIAVLLALVTDRTAMALLLGIGGIGGLLWLAERNGARRFVFALIAGAGFVGTGLELVYLVDLLSSGNWYRMNTIFKFYNGIWVLLGLASAVLLTGMLERLAGERRSHPTPAARSLADSWAFVGSMVGIVAIAASLAYPLVTTGVRLDQRFEGDRPLTLNANAWMDYGLTPTGGENPLLLSFREDRAIIDWFNAEVPGTPVIAEALIQQYRCNGSRISIGTGLPTILAWPNHQAQQRYPDFLATREEDVKTLYKSQDPEEKTRVLDTYAVEYVVVGQLERTYPEAGRTCEPIDNSAGISAFDQLVGSRLEVAFRAGDSLVYRVIGRS